MPAVLNARMQIAPDIEVVRRPADARRRRRLVELLADLLDSGTPDDARR